MTATIAVFLLLFTTDGNSQTVNATTALYERDVVKTAKLRIPQEAIQSGLGGAVRVSVIVDAEGSVESVTGAFGPGPVCTQVTRADVAAMRSAAIEAAKSVKFAASPDGETQQTWVQFNFPDKARSMPAAGKYTVKGDRHYSASNAPPSDYKGPVSATNNPDPADKGEKSSTGSGGGSGVPMASTADSGAATGAKMLSGGVLNGKAMSLPKPRYPAAARAVRAAGAVSIQVLIDEDGKIFSAEAVSGHPLLRPAAITAACGAEFSQTLLEGHPVKVSGIITYNFVP